jgi:hypothetical protein
MKFEVVVTLSVDPDSNYLGSDTDFYTEDIADLIRAMLYDIDDADILEINIREL